MNKILSIACVTLVACNSEPQRTQTIDKEPIVKIFKGEKYYKDLNTNTCFGVIISQASVYGSKDITSFPVSCDSLIAKGIIK